MGNWTLRVFTSAPRSKIHFSNWYLTIFGEEGTVMPDVDGSRPEGEGEKKDPVTTTTTTTIVTTTTTTPPTVTPSSVSNSTSLGRNGTSSGTSNLVGGNASITFFGIVGFIGAAAFSYFVCFRRKNRASIHDPYSFKELEDETAVFGGEYEGDDTSPIFDQDGDEDVIMLTPLHDPSHASSSRHH